MSRLSGGGGVVLFEVFFFFSLEIFLVFLFFFHDFTCDIFVYLKFPFLSAVERCSLSFEALFQWYQVSEAPVLLSQWN